MAKLIAIVPVRSRTLGVIKTVTFFCRQAWFYQDSTVVYFLNKQTRVQKADVVHRQNKEENHANKLF